MPNESTEKLLSFLNLLCSDNAKDKLKEHIVSVYGDDKRHKYSVITSYIYKKIAPKKDISLNLEQMCFNLRLYIDEHFKTDFERDKCKDEYEKCLEKLYDHINLELVRLNYSKSVENETFERIDNSNKKIQQIEYRAKEIYDDINKQRNQYITILGIFASIVLAFVSGISFSHSTLSNMHQVGIHKFILVLCFIALFFGNILFALFSFVREINGTDIKDDKFFWIFNIFFVAVIIIDIVIYFDRFGLNLLFPMGSK